MINIRNMTISDLPAVNEVQQSSFVKELWEDISLFKSILEKYDRTSFVAQKNGKIIGYLVTHPSRMDRDNFENGCEELSGNEECLFIHDLCVSPYERGLGIAGLLLKHLYLSVQKNNFSKFAGIAVQGAEKFWKKQGFKIIKPYPYHGEPGFLMVKD